MKTLLSLTLPCLFLLFAVSGCVQPVYETLPPIPEYPALSGNFDTSAYIEFQPDADPELNDIVKENLKKNGYSNLLPELRFKFHDLSRTRVLQLLRVNNCIYRCQDGNYMEYRVIAVVRQPGEIWNGTLEYDNPRYFQAFSRKRWNVEQVEESILRSELLRQAFANLFLIAEFRDALEPEAKSVSNLGKNSLKADEFWTISRQEKAAGNDYMAVYYAELAAKSGNKSANAYLAENLLYSDIFRPSRIIPVITRLAKDGNAVAQNQLGLMYFSGKGVNADHKLAFQWFRKAADQNYLEAQYYLGGCYENGIGTEKNTAMAKVWYYAAAKQEYQPAVKKLKELGE